MNLAQAINERIVELNRTLHRNVVGLREAKRPSPSLLAGGGGVHRIQCEKRQEKRRKDI
jgi:hypothetical protein